MTTTTSHNDASYGLDRPQRRLTTETKGADGTNGDPFGATTAMRFVVYLTIGYMVARGLAKSGSRERYNA